MFGEFAWVVTVVTFVAGAIFTSAVHAGVFGCRTCLGFLEVRPLRRAVRRLFRTRQR